MKTKDKSSAKKIKLDKLKITTLSRVEKNQIEGGLLWTWLLCIDDTEETEAN